MKNKTAFWLSTTILLLLVIYVLVCTVVLPVVTKNPLPHAKVSEITEDEKNQGNGKEKTAGEENSNIISESLETGNKKDALQKLFELRKSEKLLQSRYILANEDSMYLVLDLIDKKAILEMKGISLHECKIMDYSISNSIKMYHNESLINWFAEPFYMKNADATIAKIEFNEKIAPKDTAEANKAEVIPTAPKLGDVFIVMDFERNLRLIINQTEKPDKEGRKTISAMRWKYRKTELTRSLNSLFRFNREPAMPQIEIVLPKTDAIIIYRALPVRPKMVLRM